MTPEDARYTETALRDCRPEHLSGLADLLRFGVAAGGNTSGSFVTAAWLLNAARHRGLPMTREYRRKDDTGFLHCDADWLDSHSRGTRGGAEGQPARRDCLRALQALGATADLESLRGRDAGEIATVLGRNLAWRTPTALFDGAARFYLVLALNETRQKLLCCEVETSRARLRWFGLKALAEQSLELVSLSRDLGSPAAQLDRPEAAGRALMLDSPEGLRLLPEAEGLSVVAYAALHGHSQRDLSSCNVATLSSLQLPRGVRGKVTERVAAALEEESTGGALDLQRLLRSAAARQLEDNKGIDFDFRGLGLVELAALAERVGLETETEVLSEAGAEALERFRNRARRALGRTIVNFSRPALEQSGGGHYCVVIAYHAGADAFLLDDPAAFKTPCYWVRAKALLGAMATFDETRGVQGYRGYLVIASDEDAAQELSGSVVIRRS